MRGEGARLFEAGGLVVRRRGDSLGRWHSISHPPVPQTRRRQLTRPVLKAPRAHRDLPFLMAFISHLVLVLLVWSMSGQVGGWVGGWRATMQPCNVQTRHTVHRGIA